MATMIRRLSALRTPVRATMAAQRTAMTQALVLNKVKEIELRDIDVHEPFTADDLRIDICTVGICGSDLHYYQVRDGQVHKQTWLIV